MPHLPTFRVNQDCGPDEKLTSYAIFGDWPYTQTLLDHSNLLLNSINGDSDIAAVAHLGDIHSGGQPCIGAGMDLAGIGVVSRSDESAFQAVAGAQKINPTWNIQVYQVFQKFRKPVIYTPGDNEWTDCHKMYQFTSGAPLSELEGVRKLFFAKPGFCLGQEEKRVISQAEIFPEDAQYVENVMWQEGYVVFATFNQPGGSNNDAVDSKNRWTEPFTNDTAQNNERITREAANLRWLQATFDKAKGAHAVVLLQQADMWDTSRIPLYNYSPFVQALAELSLDFDLPVLLVNGDSHVYKADQPLVPTNGVTVTKDCNSSDECDISTIHGTLESTGPVPNFYRVVVWGSNETSSNGKWWLKLMIDPSVVGPGIFSWENIKYADAEGSSIAFGYANLTYAG